MGAVGVSAARQLMALSSTGVSVAERTSSLKAEFAGSNNAGIKEAGWRLA
jgi:hypothetical protein